MKFMILFATLSGLALADSTIVAYPEDTTKCVSRANDSGHQTGKTDITFYSCVSQTVKPELRTLHAVVEDGKTIGIAPTTAEAARLSKKYGKDFVGADSPKGRKYLEDYENMNKMIEFLMKPPAKK